MSDSQPRFGPDRTRALSLDSLRIDPAEPEPAFTAAVDWDQLIRDAKFTRLEARLFTHHWRRGVPVYRLHTALGCTKAEAQRVYQTVVHKLRDGSHESHESIRLQPVKDSLHPAYREKLHSGARPWALGAWGAEYASVMHEEKYSGLISQRDAKDFEKSARVCPGMIGAIGARMSKSSNVESIDTAAELAQAERESSTLSAKEQELRKALAALRGRWWNGNKRDKSNKPGEAAADEAQREAQRVRLQAAVEALLRNEEPSAELLGTEPLEAKIGATLRKLEIIRPALVQAAQRVAELRARQQAATDARVYAQVKPEIKEVLRLYDELVEFARAKIFEPLREVSSIEPASLFPDDIPADQQVMLFSALGSLVRVQDAEMVGGPRALLLRRRRGLNDNGTRKDAAAA